MYIIDRRLNPGGKSFANRQRFLRRAKALVQRAVRDNFKGRSIKDLDQGGEIGITRQGVHEPTLRRAASGGQRDHVLPGNKEYLEGDTIPRPSGGGGGGAGSQPGQGGDGEDEFRFVLTKEEYLDLFLDDLELPDLAKRRLMDTEAKEIQRAGYSTTGSPASLAVARTMRLSLARRLALRRPSASEILELEREIARLEQLGGQESQILALKEEHARLIRRNRRISYIDPIDLRYRRYESNPKPVAQAVMFCLMDVSGSMSEHMKDLAKRFFALLHLFLTRCYSHVDIVFIRHTDRAEEVDEQTFFYSTETGGTIVSTALEEMLTIMRQRYNPADWNIYVAQASDGDNMGSDSAKAATLLHGEILPACQYFAYLEVGREEDPMPTGAAPRPSDLWRTYETVATPEGHFVMRKVWHRREIYPVFRELFRRRGTNVRGGAA